MKILVIYKSKSGFVKKYAEWIAEECSADLSEASKIGGDMFAKYDTVIYGGGLYAAGINGLKLIKQNIDKLENKNVIVFATGVSPIREETIRDVVNKNFTPEEIKKIRFFCLRGGFDYSKLTLIDKGAMNMMKAIFKRKKELTEDERGMLAAYDEPVDFTDKKNIEEIMTYIRSLNK